MTKTTATSRWVTSSMGPIVRRIDHRHNDSVAWESLRSTYDTVAAKYEARFLDELQGKPGDRELLESLVASVEDPVVEIGCGPGHIGAFVRHHGRFVLGMDLSPEMATLAQSRLDGALVGDMRLLPFGTSSVGAMVAFYSVIHLRRPELAAAFGEFHRVLRDGGRILLSAHEGSGEVEVEEFIGERVPFAATLFGLDELVRACEEAGLEVTLAERRPPYANEGTTVRLFVEARKAGSGARHSLRAVAIAPYIRRLRELVGTELLVLPSAAVIPRDDEGRVLLVRIIDTGQWAVIGGAIEPDESPQDAARREAEEEAGVTLELGPILAVLGGPSSGMTYPNGDQTSYVSTVFAATVVGGSPRPDGDETSDGGVVGPRPPPLRGDERLHPGPARRVGVVGRTVGRDVADSRQPPWTTRRSEPSKISWLRSDP